MIFLIFRRSVSLAQKEIFLSRSRPFVVEMLLSVIVLHLVSLIFSGGWGFCPDHGIGIARRIFRRVPKPSACLAKGKLLPPLMRELFRENHRNHLRVKIFVRVG